MFQLGSAYGQINIDAAGAMGAINQVSGGLRGLGGSFQGSAVGMGTALTAGITAPLTAGAGAMIGFIGSSTGLARDMEAQMSGVQAVTGASAEEMGKLEQLIQDLGIDPNLKVSSLEAADAVEMLGRNGLSVQEIIDGAARSTVLLANATGAELSPAADAATDVMAMFGIASEDMGTAVDGITSVVNNSKFAFEDYAYALAAGGGVAAGSGVGFEDFNTAIAGTAQMFSSGSDAGTSFKTFIQRLPGVSGPAKDALAELGIITEESGNRFFDAEGNMKSMAEISGILEEALAGLADEDRNDLLATAFGTDAIRTAIGLSEMGEQGFREMQTTMGQTSAAENAATRMDNLAGALEILGGIVETIKLQIGDSFIPMIRAMAESAAAFMEENGPQLIEFFDKLAEVFTNLVSDPGVSGFFGQLLEAGIGLLGFLTQLEPQILLVGGAIAALAAVAGPVILALGLMLPALSGLGAVIGAVFSPVGLIIAGITAAIVGLGVAWATNFGGIRDMAMQAWGQIQPILSQFASLIRDGLATAFGILSDIAQMVLGSLQEWWSTHGTEVMAITREMASLIQTGLAAALQFLLNTGQTALSGLKAFWDTHGDSILTVIGNLVSGLMDGLLATYRSVSGAIQSTLTAIGAWWDEHGEAVMTIVQFLWETISTVIQTTIAVVGALIQGTLAAWKSFWDRHGSEITAILQAAWDNIEVIIDTVLTVVTAIIEAFAALIQGDWETFGEQLRVIWDAVWDGIREVLNNYVTILGNVAEMIIEAITAPFDMDWLGVGVSLVEGIAEGIRNSISLVTEAARSAAEGAFEAAKGFLGISSPSTLAEEGIGEEFPAGVARGVIKNTGSAVAAVADMARSLAAVPITTPVVGEGAVSSRSGSGSPDRAINLTVYFQGGNGGPSSQSEAEDSAYMIVQAMKARGLPVGA